MANEPSVPQRIEDSSPAAISASTWSGPLPPPAALREYEAVLPGSADRILTAHEMQVAHRIQSEKISINGDSRRSYFGLFAAFFVAVLGIGGSIYLISTDHDWAGVGLAGIHLVAIVTVFIRGSRAAVNDQSD